MEQTNDKVTVTQKLRIDRLARKEARVKDLEDRFNKLKEAEAKKQKIQTELLDLKEKALIDSVLRVILPVSRSYSTNPFIVSLKIYNQNCSLISSLREEK